MSVRQQLIDALEGRVPQRTPLSIYDWELGAVLSDELASTMATPQWSRLIDMGLGVRHHCPTVRAVARGVETSVEERTEGDVVYRIETKTTPVGSIRKVTRNGWHHEDWLKTPEDYNVQQWIVEHTQLEANYAAYDRAEQVVGEQGVVVLSGADRWRFRTPAMKINIDWAGTEQFCVDVAMKLPEFTALYEAQRELFLRELKIIAEGPGRYVVLFENLTIDMLGPQRYDELLMSAYREAAPILEAGGKRWLVHYDGQVGLISDQIAAAPFHGIDSITEPPEGDMMYDECRAAWPEMALWANINVELYLRPAEELAQAVIEKRQRAGKRALAFEISEQKPANWVESIPVVLRTLEQLD